MKFSPFGQHRQDGFNSPLTGLQFFRGLQPLGNRIQIGLVQCFKHCLRFLILSKLAQKVLGNCGRARGVVSGRPAAIQLCGFDGRQARGLDFSLFPEPLDMTLVGFGPQTSGAPRREFDQVGRRIEWFSLPVDPALAQGFIQCLGIGNRLAAGVFLENSQSQAG